MAFLSHCDTYPMRSTNKEPQWTSVYDELFNEYIDTERFELVGDYKPTTSGSDETSNNTSGSSEGLTDSSEGNSPEARRYSEDFWAKTLHALEESAASHGQAEQRGKPTPLAYSTKHHPHSDFLSLGGYPSPHIGSSPTISPSEAARRRKVSRHQSEYSVRPSERPTGINKGSRAASKSPKMMTPSRFRSGFRDAWAQKMNNPRNVLDMNLPIRSLPLSPPPSAKVNREFCSPSEIDASAFQASTNLEERFSVPGAISHAAPLHSPSSSPLTTPGVERNASYSEPSYHTLHNLNIYWETTAPFQPQTWRTADIEDEDDDEDDDAYETSPTISPWLVSERRYSSAPDHERYHSISHLHDLHRSSIQDLSTSGLMISYDPTLAPAQPLEEEEYTMDTAYMPPTTTTPYYTTLPQTPPPQTPSSSPPRSYHRRTSSKGRKKHHSRKSSSSGGSFVNYTPSDSAKLLTGVAPSGSSKTKARREREAAEKKRKFSQAAVKAVEDAGGSIEALQNAGIIL